MPGSVADPVRLDPYQTITEVHWGRHERYISLSFALPTLDKQGYEIACEEAFEDKPGTRWTVWLDSGTVHFVENGGPDNTYSGYDEATASWHTREAQNPLSISGYPADQSFTLTPFIYGGSGPAGGSLGFDPVSGPDSGIVAEGSDNFVLSAALPFFINSAVYDPSDYECLGGVKNMLITSFGAHPFESSFDASGISVVKDGDSYHCIGAFYNIFYRLLFEKSA